MLPPVQQQKPNSSIRRFTRHAYMYVYVWFLSAKDAVSRHQLISGCRSTNHEIHFALRENAISCWQMGPNGPILRQD